MESDVIVIVLQRRSGRQDHIGMPCRFVERRVDRDHEIQFFKRLIQHPTIWRGQHRVSCPGEHQSDLALPLGADFIHHGGRRELVIELGQAPPTGGKAPKTARVGVHDLIHRRKREQTATWLVEVSCCDVNHLNRPLAQCAIGLGAHPHPAIADACLGLCQLMRNAHDIVS